MTQRVTYQETVELSTETCCNCSVLFALPSELMGRLRARPGSSFYCPNGHAQHYTGESEAQKLRREVERLRQQEARHEEEKLDLRKRADAAVRARKRVEKRVHAGVCPDCNRSFANMARHMQTKHSKPDLKCVGGTES